LGRRGESSLRFRYIFAYQEREQMLITRVPQKSNPAEVLAPRRLSTGTSLRFSSLGGATCTVSSTFAWFQFFDLDSSRLKEDEDQPFG
jgi:hypothetical protein